METREFVLMCAVFMVVATLIVSLPGFYAGEEGNSAPDLKDTQ